MTTDLELSVSRLQSINDETNLITPGVLGLITGALYFYSRIQCLSTTQPLTNPTASPSRVSPPTPAYHQPSQTPHQYHSNQNDA
jgi:hypothetical protein